MFLARSQFTGPPCHDIRSANWRSASANCCGSPMGPSGPIAPNGPAGPPPEPEPPDPPGTSGSSPESLPGPKPNGGSVMYPASRGHLPDLSGRMEGSTLAKLSQERSEVSNRVAQVRAERSTNAGSGVPATRRGQRKTGDANGPIAAAPVSVAPVGEAGAPHLDAVTAVAGSGAEAPRPVVAVTGAATGLGLALTARLAHSPAVGRVVAIDDSRGDVSGVTWRIIDVRDPALAGRLSDVDVVVHTAVDYSPDSDARIRRAFNVRGAQTVLTAAAAGGVGRVVLVTSAMVYGARPDNPVPLPE